MFQEDTIAALVTAIGESSVGIIRISGPEAIDIAEKLYEGKANLREVPTHTIQYGYVYDREKKKKIDEALFMIMKGPRSFTGEDVVEIQCHGGIVIMREVLQLVLSAGARIADPGEYSKRAFLNGKKDLAQAESIMDLVQAKTEKAVDLAMAQLQGGLSGQVQELRADLLELIAFIQADIDYPDDDIERLTTEQYQNRVENNILRVDKLLKNAEKGKMIRDGLRIVIAGKPNVGKSSLMNAMLGQERAIVTNIPGTTRDIIEEMISLNGIPIKLADTAGIRDTDDYVEQIGVDRAKQMMSQADLVLYVFDSTGEITDYDEEMLSNLEGKKVIYILNKMDLEQEKNEKFMKFLEEKKNVISISAKEKKGLEQLEQMIMDLFWDGSMEVGDDVMVTNIRHIQILEQCRNHMKGFLTGMEMGLSVDFLVIDLQNSWEKLGSITGETIEDDLLDQIFSKFCLGK